MGGCYDEDTNDCIVCKNFTFELDEKKTCLKECPPGTFQHYDRRCITESECKNLNNIKIELSEEKKDEKFIPFDGQCSLGCPPGYQSKDNTCQKCLGPCSKRCHAKIIDSIGEAQKLEGCSVITNSLEIQLRSQVGAGANIVKELERYLSSIEEIHGFLKIARSYPIISLSFLKNLKKIKGNTLDKKKFSLYVLDNQNLQELWGENPEISIERGQLFFNFNPKLCFYKIKTLISNRNGEGVKLDNEDMVAQYNGDKTVCKTTTLHVTATVKNPYAALLEWSPLQVEDERTLLGYVVSHIVAPSQNVTMYDGRDACGQDGWRTDDVTDYAVSSKVAFPLTRLEPFTQYAYYVKTYIIASEQQGGQSSIQYFQTWPGKPEAVRKLVAVSQSSSELVSLFLFFLIQN